MICRVGDPQDPHDLLRVGAHRATAILSMMSDDDHAATRVAEGSVHSSSSVRTLLALRHVRFQRKDHIFWKDFRAVFNLNYSGSWKNQYIDAARFEDPGGNKVVEFVQLGQFVNQLMFHTASHPGAASVVMDLLSFEGCAIRARDAAQMGLIGMTIADCRRSFYDLPLAICKAAKHTVSVHLLLNINICWNPNGIDRVSKALRAVRRFHKGSKFVFSYLTHSVMSVRFGYKVIS